MLNNVFIFFVLITFSCCSLGNKTQLKNNNFIIARSFKDSVLKTKPKFLPFNVDKATFRYVYEGQVHTLKSNIYLATDSIATINLYTPFNISVLNLSATLNEIEIIDKKNNIFSRNTYPEVFKAVLIPLQLTDIINITIGQGFFPHSPKEEHILNRLISTSKNLVIDKYSVSIDGSIFNVISKYILPYNKLISREIYNEKGDPLLKTHYIITENSFDNFPKEISLEFTLNGKRIEFEFQLSSFYK